jgi:membrane-associated protease RseP (regulator of RpoE activity)
MSSGVLYAVNAVAIVLILLASVAIHELGHLVTAKHYGMKATEYFVGFGPRIFSFRRGETEYGLKAIPAGGYVKIIGMSPLENHDKSKTPEQIERAAEEMARLPTDLVPDERRLFYTYPARQRSLVLAAGSLTHFVLAIALTFAALAIGGDPTESVTPQPVFAAVAQCVNSNADGTCPPGAQQSAAAKAGLRAGDRITAVGGTTITSYNQLAAIIRASAGVTLQLHILRAGAALVVSVTPTVGEKRDSDGNLIPNTREGFLGISPVVPNPSTSIGHAVVRTFPALGNTLKSTGGVLAHLPAEVGDVLTGKQRNASDSAVSVVGVVRAAGQVGASKDYSTRTKVLNIVFLGAELNLFVGIVNLLPLLPLDGGHIAIVWFEKLRAFVARRRRRPDPGRVNILKVLPAAYSVFALIVLLSVILVYADIASPIKVT